MKKILFSLVVLLSVCGYVVANPPEASDGSSMPVEYGGLKFSTSSFSINGATITGKATIPYVIFSSGTVDDYVSIFQTTSPTMTNPHVNEVARIYNVGNSTAPTPAAFGRGVSPAGNIRVGSNWMWKPSVTAYNIITLLYESQ